MQKNKQTPPQVDSNKNIQCNIKGLYKQMAPVRDKYPKLAYKNKVDLEIYLDDKFIVIPFEELRNYADKSKTPVKDFYSNDWHFLIYYAWKNAESKYQPKLF